ncbi:MAG: hypothetical protein R3B70_33030 [Polyangiaceae bacterium]
MIQIFLAGEGRNELGDHASEEPYRSDRPSPGVLEALLAQVQPSGWKIAGAVRWRDLPKLRVGLGKRGEEHNVRAAHHHAKKRGCHVLAFSRDRDNPKFAHRTDDIERAITDLATDPAGPSIIGAVAIERLESWLLATFGEHGSESHRHPESHLESKGLPSKDTAAMVAHIERTGLAAIPPDARSFNLWLTRARAALTAAETPR